MSAQVSQLPDPTMSTIDVVTAAVLTAARLSHQGDVTVEAVEPPSAVARSSTNTGFEFEAEAPASVVGQHLTPFVGGTRPTRVRCTCSGCGSTLEHASTVVTVRSDDGAGWLVDLTPEPHGWERFGSERLRTALTGLATMPDARTDDIVLAGPQEREALGQLHGEVRERPDVTLDQLIFATAERNPQSVAIAFEGQTITYQELAQRAGTVAAALQRAGVSPGEVVAVCAPRCLELSIALLGILKAGCAYLPIVPTQPAARAVGMLRDADVRVALCSDPNAKPLSSADPSLLRLDLAGRCDPPASLPAVDRPVAKGAAYVIFTSGSTGRPKGVLVPHRAVVNRLVWLLERFPLTETDAVAQKTPADFDVSVWEFFWPLIAGARSLLAGPQDHLDPELLGRTLGENGATVVHFVPSLLEVFLREPPHPGRQSVRLLMTSGEALPPGLATRAQHEFGATVINLYGPTEAAIDVTEWTCRDLEPGPTVPIGRPLPNVRAHVLSPSGEPVPLGATGELWLSGDCLADGYVNRPELTAEMFQTRPDGSGGHARLYRTGDVASWDPRLLGQDGKPVLRYHGRRDQQIKLRGVRIEATEIEHILELHPAVRRAVVEVVRSDDGDRLAALVACEDHTLSTSVIRRHTSRMLPPSMVPTLIRPVADIPLTSNGKADRRRVRELLLETAGHDVPGQAPSADLVRSNREEIE